MRGEMLWFDEAKDFGFIRTGEGEKLYVHRSGFLPGEAPVGRCAGKQVSFEREVAEGEHAHQAVSVSIVPEASGGRARRRRQHSFR